MLTDPAISRLIRTALGSANRYGTEMSPRYHISPSRSRRSTSSTPQTRAALSTMASSTGCTSVGERLMMPSTSDVAV